MAQDKTRTEDETGLRVRSLRALLPRAAPGQVIGLLGGSFDPAHEGHAHITREALRRFDLDQVWWLVSPGNPLKQTGPAPLSKRMQRARQVMQHPRVAVTDIECAIGTRYTAQTLQTLQAVRPDLRFVWLMGADNLAQVDQWQDWRWIFDHVPIGVLARPGDRAAARGSVAAKTYQFARLRGRESRLLAQSVAPAWCFVNVAMKDVSSTEIRAAGGWANGASATD
ncbi:nicotinate-nucleotide adenylyltransferase [Litorivita pollutaquae]|uniref:Probable nicotinate-nucleotide adenylyltransferase n=1 Tax=Litorivita pollutaquae TaxID=2200892 RepID=A0A2V4NDM3_9RHOB|nr:nicotinate-nucleotide adenylyltransferase [Litorivita pollutaquae]PYC47910.1 nicotinate-nucleotide adenylyltransferase [Litorivita pollutaquae]